MIFGIVPSGLRDSFRFADQRPALEFQRLRGDPPSPHWRDSARFSAAFPELRQFYQAPGITVLRGLHVLNASCVPGKLSSLCIRLLGLLVVVAGPLPATSQPQTFVPGWTQESPATSPPARNGHAMAYDSAHGQVVLFGGVASGYLNDTWLWNGTNWTLQSPATSPPARYAHAMAYDSAHAQEV
jgi:hypothetical protein